MTTHGKISTANVTASIAGILLLAAAIHLNAAELHVTTNGNDTNPATVVAPLRTIQKASDLTQPGDVVTVHAGVYRERVDPSRGGESDAKRISEAAAAKNKAFQEKLFKTVMAAFVSFPDFLENRDALLARIEADRKETFDAGMQEVQKYSDALRQTLVIQPHLVEVIPVTERI